MSRSPMPHSHLRIGLLGCGAIAQFAHLPALERARRVKLAAVCDASRALAEKAALRAGAGAVYDSHEALLADPNVDAVLIAAGDAFHVPLACEALAAGKHVLVEKPMGTNSRECLELVRLADRTGLKVQVASMKRHDPGLEFAHQFARERLGQVLSAGGWYRDTLFRPAMQESILPPLEASDDARRPPEDVKRTDKRRYSFVTHGVHLLDNLRWLGGEIRAVTVRSAEAFGQFTWHGLLEFAGGGLGHFELTVKVNSDWSEGYVVHGEGGSIEARTFWPFYQRSSEVRAMDARAGQWHSPLGADSSPYKRQLEAFAGSVLDDRPSDPDAREGLAAVRLLEACWQSAAADGRREPIPGEA